MSQTEASPLEGTWKLIAFQIEFENGERRDAYDQASGALIMSSDGRMLAIVTDDARQSSDPPNSLFDRMMAYSGRYHLQGDDSFVTDVDVAWHPSWLGTEQARYFKVEGGTLSIITAPGKHPKYPGLIRGILTWRRE